MKIAQFARPLAVSPSQLRPPGGAFQGGAAPGWRHLARVLPTGLAMWFAPLLLARSLEGFNSVFVQTGLFFGRAAVVTFGSAYAVLGYVDQQAVEKFGWLQRGEMLDGLGLACRQSLRLWWA